MKREKRTARHCHGKRLARGRGYFTNLMGKWGKTINDRMLYVHFNCIKVFLFNRATKEILKQKNNYDYYRKGY